MQRFVVALVLCVPLARAADTDQPQDYTHALPLAVSGKQGVVQFRLPQAVYLHARTESLADLRVFDADGHLLPYTLRYPSRQAQTNRRTLPLKVFPVMAQAAPTAAGVSFDVRTDSAGGVVSATARVDAKPATAGEQLAALVLDLQQETSVDALRFTLPAGAKNYRAVLRLDVSDDLKHWTMAGQSELSWFVNGEAQALVNDRLEFPAQPVRYARLTWVEGAPLQFAGIAAESPSYTVAGPATEQLVLQPHAGRFDKDLVYDAAPAIPVHGIGLQFDEQNVSLPAQIGRYTEQPGRDGRMEWRFRPVTTATFYRIAQVDRTRSSGDVPLPDLHADSWVLRPMADSPTRPALRIAWTPATLVFLANGRGPYQLVFGRSGAMSHAAGIDQVAPGFSDAELNGVETATAGALLEQHAQDKGVSEAELAARDKRNRLMLLWGVLLAGVLALASMVFKLVRQMKR